MALRIDANRSHRVAERAQGPIVVVVGLARDQRQLQRRRTATEPDDAHGIHLHLAQLRISQLHQRDAIAEILPGYEYSAWYGLVGPAKLPKQMLEKLANAARAARAALASPEMPKRLVDEGLIPVGSTPAEFQKFVASEIVRWGKVVAATGAKPE